MNRGRRTESRVLFGYFLHDAKSDKPFPLQRTSRFCKPRISAPEQQLLTNKIKTVPFREVRGFPNLDSAHPNIKYTLTKLKPSQRELRGSANLESAYPNNNFPLTKLNPFKESSPDKKHVSETNIRDVQKGEIHAIRAVLWEANRPKPFRCRFKVMLFRCHPWR